jgi:A/G-specific adenine glycosylase
MHDQYQVFRQTVTTYYQAHGRHDLPWRQPETDGTFDPYQILLSEVMLQQTQVQRVIPKYHTFLVQFPTVQALTEAPLGDVLVVWQGLGYNRRAKFLWLAAQLAVREYGGVFPNSRTELERLPGIGPNTAGAILAYAFNEPALFIETNIRTAYIHHFFRDQSGIPDAAIMELLQKTLDTANPRQFYWALMDYGSYLKRTVGNVSRASKVYAKQSQFTGSLRQLRGQILRLLAAGPVDAERLINGLADPRSAAVLDQLEAEGLVCRSDATYRLP